jgi:hypothetical protein
MRLLTCRYLNEVPRCARVRHLPALRLRVRMYDALLGGCDQPAAACEVHDVTHLADGAKTSVDGCAPYCFFHHVAIHQWSWKVTLNPDAPRSSTATATATDRRPPALGEPGRRLTVFLGVPLQIIQGVPNGPMDPGPERPDLVQPADRVDRVAQQHDRDVEDRRDQQ